MRLTRMLTVLLVFGLTVFATADSDYQTGFESPTFTSGQSVDGIENWDYPGTTKTSAKATTAVTHSGSQSLVFAYASEAGNQYLTFDMASQIGAKSGMVITECWLNISSISKTLLLQVYGTREGSSVTNIAQVSFNTDNSVSAVSAYTTTDSTQSWVSGQWLHVVVKVDTDTDKQNVFINGTPVWSSPVNLRSNYLVSDITCMSIFKESYATGTVYVDDFKMGINPLALVSSSSSSYSIVISQNASDAEIFAADELADFFELSTGVTLPIITDAQAATDKEIVIGAARGFNINNIDSRYLPAVKEGYALYREDEKIYISGTCGRGTLYGVYDFLEKDLGMRFLTPDYTYTPDNSELNVEFRTRKYDPQLEYRNLMVKDTLWAVRNRLNGKWAYIPMETTLGGVKWVGPKFVHTFEYLVSPDEYFDTHPEYFSMIDGVRVEYRTQLCLTNTNVKNIALAEVTS